MSAKQAQLEGRETPDAEPGSLQPHWRDQPLESRDTSPEALNPEELP